VVPQLSAIRDVKWKIIFSAANTSFSMFSFAHFSLADKFKDEFNAI